MKPPVRSTPSRVYADVAVAAGQGGSFAVELDGRALKTPAGALFAASTRAAAELVAEEWRRQDGEIDPATMPMTRLAFTAADRGEAAREALVEEVARYAASDLLCYFAQAPAALVALQEDRWGAQLEWARRALGVDLVHGVGVMPVEQPAASLGCVRGLAGALDVFGLVALVGACGLFGSAVLAFALARGDLPASEAHELARLDEVWQEQQWGVDAEAARRTEARWREASDLERWFVALRST